MTLRQMYTSGEAESLVRQPNPLGAIFGAGLFDVEANDRSYQEMHVDGTVSAPVLMDPDGIVTFIRFTCQ